MYGPDIFDMKIVFRLIKAFQFVEKHGEVCPANWTPDAPTIKPDPKESSFKLILVSLCMYFQLEGAQFDSLL